MEMLQRTERAVEILLVEDNPGDIQLLNLLLKETKLNYKLTTLKDGVEATYYMFNKVKNSEATRPDFIILDLNLPRKNGREVLKELKEDPNTCGIPILILTTSRANEDIKRCYELHANCYISKPTELTKFNAVMKSIEDFWFATAELPNIHSSR